MEEALANDSRQMMIGLGEMGLLLITAVVFLTWIHRANCNTRAIGALAMQFTPGWCVGWFFIPLANWIMPYRATKEIWFASGPKTMPEAPDGPQQANSSVIAWWWWTWVIGGILGQIAFRMGDVGNSTRAAILANIAHIVAAIFAVLVVRGIQARQEQKHREMIPAEVSTLVQPSDRRRVAPGDV